MVSQPLVPCGGGGGAGAVIDAALIEFAESLVTDMEPNLAESFFIGDEFEAVSDEEVSGGGEPFFDESSPWQEAVVLNHEWRRVRHRWPPDATCVYAAALVPVVPLNFEVVALMKTPAP